MKTIVKYWYSKHPLMFLLLPLSYLYQFGFQLHKLVYSLGIKKKYQSPVPVVVVGNITVGGTGKTPFTIELAQILLANGYMPGLISRGYRGKAKQYPQWVTAESDPSLVGDEPVLLATVTKCPVVVAPKRSDAIEMLLKKSNCNVILSDDGLQHHAIQKDIEIVIIDGQRKFGNGFCLPAGPLRESMHKLSKVDYIVFNDDAPNHNFSMSLKMGAIYNLLNDNIKSSIHTFKNCKIHGVAAIGHPDRFFNSLREIGLNITEHVFPDHHHFTLEDFDFCDKNDVIIMTQKDAVKCRKFALNNFWVLPVRTQINDNFIRTFFKQLKHLRVVSPQ